jgi:hypothetical protein
MTQKIVTAIPSAKSAAAQLPILYFVECAHHTGAFFPEINSADTSKWQVIADIASAQHERVLSVTMVDRTNKRCEDVSVEIAREVLNQVLDERGEVPMWCEDFLEKHLGVQTVALAQFEAAA